MLAQQLAQQLLSRSRKEVSRFRTTAHVMFHVNYLPIKDRGMKRCGAVVGSAYIMAKQIEYPADTVDAAGKVWPTVGENIRNGANGFDYDALMDKMIKDMYPMNFILVGEVPSLVSKHVTFAPLPYNVTMTGVIYDPGLKSGAIKNNNLVVVLSDDGWNNLYAAVPSIGGKPNHCISLRFWTRVV